MPSTEGDIKACGFLADLTILGYSEITDEKVIGNPEQNEVPPEFTVWMNLIYFIRSVVFL